MPCTYCSKKPSNVVCVSAPIKRREFIDSGRQSCDIFSGSPPDTHHLAEAAKLSKRIDLLTNIVLIVSKMLGVGAALFFLPEQKAATIQLRNSVSWWLAAVVFIPKIPELLTRDFKECILTCHPFSFISI
jgi:hypothetical protein